MKVITERLPIYKIRASGESDCLRKYGHPNGWRIVKVKRSWSERGGPQGLPSQDAIPLYWWEVRRQGDQVAVQTCSTLGAARDWCDEHESRESR